MSDVSFAKTTTPFDADPCASSLRRALLRPVELAARQRARAHRPHDDGGVARGARRSSTTAWSSSFPRCRMRCACALRPSGFCGAPCDRCSPSCSRARRASRSRSGPGCAASSPSGCSITCAARAAHAAVLRRSHARSPARRASRRAAQPRRHPVDAFEPRDLAAGLPPGLSPARLAARTGCAA